MKSISLIVVLVIMLVLTACGASTPAPAQPREVLVRPESDNSYFWSESSHVVVSTQSFRLTAEVYDDIANHTEINSSSSSSGYVMGGTAYYSSSSRIWQDGKGILPVKVVSIDPIFHGIDAGSYILLKTTDLKAMGIPVGSVAEFVCNEDVEVLSPNVNYQELTEDRLTYELDDCRLVTPEFEP